MVLKVVIFFAIVLMAKLGSCERYFGSDTSGGLTGVLLGLEDRKKQPVVLYCLGIHTSIFKEETKKMKERVEEIAKQLTTANEDLGPDMETLLGCVWQINERVWPFVLEGDFIEALKLVDGKASLVRAGQDAAYTAASINKSLKRNANLLGITLYEWEKECEEIGESVHECITANSTSNS